MIGSPDDSPKAGLIKEVRQKIAVRSRCLSMIPADRRVDGRAEQDLPLWSNRQWRRGQDSEQLYEQYLHARNKRDNVSVHRFHRLSG